MLLSRTAAGLCIAYIATHTVPREYSSSQHMPERHPVPIPKCCAPQGRLWTVMLSFVIGNAKGLQAPNTSQP